VFNWLYTAVSWVLLRWHELLTLFGLDAGGGLNWALSIILLVATARLLLFRLFVKQVKYQRHMQKLQPKMKELREKYKSDKQEMQRQLMKLQQEEGFNPLSGCLPILLQLPVFWGLYHVLRHLANSAPAAQKYLDHQPLTAGESRQLGLYGFTHQQAADAATSILYGAPLAARLFDSTEQLAKLSGHVAATHIVIIVLVVFSACATFSTQLLVRRAQVTAPEGTAAMVQRLMLFGIPVGTLISGTFFPLGVLIYWFGNNNWTMLQQLYINKFHPQEESAQGPVGELGKTLAPKPGQRPVRPQRKTAQSTQTVEPEAESPEAESREAESKASPAPPRSSTPRPGQRPSRPAAKRPPTKRPTKSKKRR
jgi:YidC/Oxa1 family membrane protein insertase